MLPRFPGGDIHDYVPGNCHTLMFSNDGQYLLEFNTQLTVYRSESLKLVQTIPIERPFNQSPDGQRFIGLANNGSHLLLGRFDSIDSIKTIPLPGPQGYDPKQPDKPAPVSSVTIDELAITNDGQRLFASLHRNSGDADGRVKLLACYDVRNQTWSETRRDAGLDWMTDSNIKIDPTSRLLTTEGKYSDATWFRDFRYPHEDRADGRFLTRTIWDATTSPLQPLNKQKSIPNGIGYFNSTGDRLIQLEFPEVTCSIYDATTLALIAKHHEFDWNQPVFSSEGKWMALEDENERGIKSQVANYIPTLLTRLFPQEQTRIRIIRLSDGAVSRTIPCPESHGYWDYTTLRMLPNGSLWTLRRVESTEELCTLAVERWSPEPPTPWWLIVFSTFGLGLIVRDWRRRGVSTVQSPLTRTDG